MSEEKGTPESEREREQGRKEKKRLRPSQTTTDSHHLLSLLLPRFIFCTLSSKESEERVLSSSPAARGAKSESVRSGAVAGWGLREDAAAAGAGAAASDEAASTAAAFAAAAALSLDCLLVVTLHVASEEDPGVSVAVEGAALPKGEGRAPRTQFGVSALAAEPMPFSPPRSLLLAGGVALGAAWRILLLLLLSVSGACSAAAR